MNIVKYVVLGVIVAVTIYLIVDTTIYVIRKVRQKKRAKQVSNDVNKTE